MKLLTSLVMMLAVVKMSAGLAVVSAGSNVQNEFKLSNLQPDVIDSSPILYLKVQFPSGVEANLGNDLTPTQVKDQPYVSYEADDDSFYALIFIDPDNYHGPDPVYREFRHWVVVNIPGGDVSRGESLAGYISSGPLSGIHRYTFLLFKQSGKLNFEETKINSTTIGGRDGFSTRIFAEKYGLGAPLAGNFYRAQYDDYVPLLYKSLGAEDMLIAS